MKTFFATVIAICTISLVNASEERSEVDVGAVMADLVSVDISSVATSHFEIDVTNAYGKNLYSMTTDAPQKSLNQKFDFTELEDGTYYVEVKMDKETRVKTLKVEYGVVEVIKERRLIEPYFNFKDDLLKFTYLNPQLENTLLIVYDKNDEVVSEAKLGNAMSISKAINFKGQKRGAYNVVIANERDVYEYTVLME